MLHSSTYRLPPSNDHPYVVTAKRYTIGDAGGSGHNASEGITLILGHCIGMFKESWEPVLEDLFEIEAGQSSTPIFEAWSFDCPHHGQDGNINEPVLLADPTQTFPGDAYGRAIGRFLTADERQGAQVDFSKHNLVALGHSVGASSLIWLHHSPEFPVRFQSFILVEPMLNAVHARDISACWPAYIAFAYQRRDTWESSEAAFQDMLKTMPYMSWDRRAIASFVTYGLREHPAASFSIEPFSGVALACSRMAEAAVYRGTYQFAHGMVSVLACISKDVPIHFIWGAVEDSLTQGLRDALMYKCGIVMASHRWIPDAGHLVPLQAPGATAAVIDKLLRTTKHTGSRP
ncbi:hypothetical protein FRB93_001064 [Tulasnella sp. JGI-2019a]|nr:hypothetical protein FRB93_001064 [Tulasnella sp. JGI-2019a]